MPATRTSKRKQTKGKAQASEPSPESVEVVTVPETQNEEVPTTQREADSVKLPPSPPIPTPPTVKEDQVMDDVSQPKRGPSEDHQMAEAAESDESENPQTDSNTPKLTLEERAAKMEQLRKKLAASSKANRASLVEESAKAKITARDAARLDKQRKLAEVLRSKADAEEKGEDVERGKNWEWTIEDNDNWEKKKARKARRADFEFHDDAHAARRRYKKDLDLIKPDLDEYNRQKEQAMGLEPGTLANFDPTSSSLQLVQSQEQQLAADNFYRDANTLIYGDSKPSEDAIDRVVGKINNDIDKKGKFSRKRLNEDEGDITYINEHNRVFNKKIARYYDRYTSEIRASFERGTAL